MNDQFITFGDAKLILIGAIAALIASAVIYFARHLVTSKSKLYWAYGSTDFWLKSENERIEHHEITIENVGKGLAREIVVAMPKTSANFDIRKIERGRNGWNGWYSAKTSNFTLTDDSRQTRLLIPHLEGSTIIKISFFTVFRTPLRPESISYDGGIGLDRIMSPAYFRTWDVIRPSSIRLFFILSAMLVTAAIAFVTSRK